jgi:hypothetical protein
MPRGLFAAQKRRLPTDNVKGTPMAAALLTQQQPAPTAPLTHADAVKLDSRLRRAAADTGKRLAEIAALIAMAKAGDIHRLLDYPSRPDYVASART